MYKEYMIIARNTKTEDTRVYFCATEYETEKDIESFKKAGYDNIEAFKMKISEVYEDGKFKHV